jgi:hypothetical protein
MKLITTGYQLCYECHRRTTPVVEIGTMDEHGHIDQESGGTFCLDCLRAAVALIEAEHPQRPQPGDFVAGVVLTAEGDTIFRMGTWPGKGEDGPQGEQPAP